MKQNVYVGIDVSCDRLDVYRDDTQVFGVFENTSAGWAALADELKEVKPERILLEPTGNYEKGLLKTLLAHGLPAVRIHASRVRAFADALGERAKSDPIDAKVLATFGRCLDTPVTKLPAPEIQTLQELRRYRDFLVEQIVSTGHLARSPSCTTTRSHVQTHLASLKRLLQSVEADLKVHVKKCPALQAQIKLLETVPGIGWLSALALVTELPELGTLSPKKIAALVGVAPYVRRSGRYQGQSRISGGRDRTRKALYMPTLVAVRFNPIFAEFYQRLVAAGKPKKKALIACLRKLVCRLNAMVRDQQPWLPT